MLRLRAMDLSILEEIGLSRSESKVYIALLELGLTKVGPIIEKSGVVSSVVHNVLNTLLEKGLISYIKKGKVKVYQAVPPKQILDFIEERKKHFMNILPELEGKQKLIKDEQEAEIFEGKKGILAMLNLLIDNAKKYDDYLFFSTYLQEGDKEVQDFFKMYDAKRKEKGLNIRGLAPLELKPLFIKRKALKMKYTSEPIPSDISICNNNVAVISWGEKPIGYLIKSKQISDMFRNLFNSIWKKLK
jgi:sugar-specific transcriptional regulator TrmB